MSDSHKKVRQTARKIIGQAGLDQLAEHDTALVHHASEIEKLIARQDDMLTKAAKHAADLDVAFVEIDRRAEPLRRPLLGRLRWLLTGN